MLFFVHKLEASEHEVEDFLVIFFRANFENAKNGSQRLGLEKSNA